MKLLTCILWLFIASPAFAAGITSDAADDFINCGTGDTMLKENSAQSVVCIIYPISEGESSGRIISKESAAGVGVRLVVNDVTAGGDAELGFQVSGGTSMLNPQADGELTVNAWHIVGYAWDGGTEADNADIYVDGSQVNYGTRQDMVTPTNNATGTIGFFNRGNADRTFDGTIMSCYVWTSQLTAAQMAWLTELPVSGDDAIPGALAYKAMSISSSLEMSMVFDAYASGINANGLVYKDRTGTYSCTVDDGANNAGTTTEAYNLLYPVAMIQGQ